MNKFITALVVALSANLANAEILFQAGHVNYINSMSGGSNTEIAITHEGSDSLVLRKISGGKTSVIATVKNVPFGSGANIGEPVLSPNQKWAVLWVEDDHLIRFTDSYLNVFFVGVDGKKTIQIDACQFVREASHCEFETRNDKTLYFDPNGKFALLEISSSPSNSYDWVDTRDQVILKIDLQSGLVSKIYAGPLKLLPKSRDNYKSNSSGFSILPSNGRFLGMVGIQGKYTDLTAQQQYAQLDLSNFSIKAFFVSWQVSSTKNLFEQSSTLIHKQGNIALVKLSEYEIKTRNIIKTELRQVDFDKATSIVVNEDVEVFDESANLNSAWLVKKDDGLHAIDFAGQNHFLAKADKFQVSEDGKWLATTLESQPFSITITRADGSTNKTFNIDIPIFFLQNLKAVELMDIGYVDENSVGLRFFTSSENVGWYRWFLKISSAGTEVIDRAGYSTGQATERGEPSRYQGQIATYQEVNLGFPEKATALIDYSTMNFNYWYPNKTEDKRQCRFKLDSKSFICAWMDHSGNGYVENVK